MEEEKPKRGRLGGRAKGTPNKVTSDMRRLIKDYLLGDFDEFVRRMRQCEHNEYCRHYQTLLKFIVPTISTIEFTNGSDGSSVLEKLKAIDKESENENE